MTRYTDAIESGTVGLTSAQSTRSHVILDRLKRFTGGGNITWTGFFPYGATQIGATLNVLQNGSAATSDRMVISTSAGATPLITFTAFGSAGGRFSNTTVGLGTVAIVASAAWQVGPVVEGADVPFQVILSSVDSATDYGLSVTFRRPFTPGM